MFLSALSSAMHYILHSIDRQSEDPWENKTIYIRLVDIVLGNMSACMYLQASISWSVSMCMQGHVCWSVYCLLFPFAGFFELALYVGYMAFMLYVLFIPLHIARRVYVTAKYVPGCGACIASLATRWKCHD